MYPDYHMHTNFSDGRDTHEDMLASALVRGVSEIGFSDHISVKPVNWSMELSAIPLMVETILQLKEKSINFLVKLGAEVDYIVGKEKQIAEDRKSVV